jgi:EAL domain-containing protein (putative c-di-GMP-specific phosphodiesterase class I)/ActR/RegA family two-component response regulator
VSAPQSVLIIDDDEMLTTGLAALLERDGRTVITCNDLAAAELLVDRYQPSHVLSDVRFSGPFAYEGLDFLPYVREHAPGARVILMTGDGSTALESEAVARGAVGFLRKPFDSDELDATIELPPTRDSKAVVMSAPALDEILASPSLRPFFQPIVALQDGAQTVAYESLARFRSDAVFRTPDLLFRYASRKRRTADLELACAKSTMRSAVNLPGEPLIFMNIHPDVFRNGGRLLDTLRTASIENDLPLSRVVLEITEQAPMPAAPAVWSLLDELRFLGARFAFDDVGVAYSHLSLIEHIKPSFFKISQAFGSGFESDANKLRIVRNIVSLAGDFGCEVVLEGIENESTAMAATTLGIHYGQGYHFGRPAAFEVH